MNSLLRSTLALLFVSASLHASDALYHREVVVPADASPRLTQTAERLASLLSKMTGESFAVRNDSNQPAAIRLIAWNSEGALPPEATALERFDPRNTESYALIDMPSTGGLRIVGVSEQGVELGIYRYLHELGYRSLLPGENWQIVPRRDDIRLGKNLAKTPDFLFRGFFGTGGFHRNLPLDPEGRISTMWDQWSRANGYGGSIHLAGHYGEAFALKHRKSLEAHPEYRAMIDGERVAIDQPYQINYGNPDLRELYLQDRLAELRHKVKTAPFSPLARAVSVDPADNGVHCESPESLALGSVSDRVFGMANDVARAVSQEFPGKVVTLFAYNAHAELPKQELEPNVVVFVVPYGFSRALTLMGEDLLKAWSQKAETIGVYDYWALPDWSYCQPQLDYLDTLPRRIQFWYEHRVRYVNLETTSSAGAAGLPLYLASRMFQEMQTDPHGVVAEFYDLAFGPARAPMQRMMERWASGFRLHDNELALSLRDIGEATALAASDPAVQARVADFASYIHYLRLLWEMQSLAPNSDEREERADALMRWIWQIRNNAMVQTFRLTQLARNVLFRENDSFRARWDYDHAEAPGWATVPPAPDLSTLAALIQEGEEAYPILFEPIQFASQLAPLSDSPPTEVRAKSIRLLGGHEFLFRPEQAGELNFGFQFGGISARDLSAGPRAIVEVTDVESGEQIFSDYPVINREEIIRAIPVQAHRLYRMKLHDRSTHGLFTPPPDLPLVFEGGAKPVGAAEKLWFYVPRGTKRFAIEIPRNAIAPQLEVAAEGRIPISPMLERNGYTVYDVPEGSDGTAWSIHRFASPLKVRLHNVPDYLALSRETLLIPEVP